MRRTILVVLASVFFLCAGLWVGGFIAVGAFAAPLAFKQLGTGPAGLLIGHVFRRLNVFSSVLLALMLLISLFEIFYRKRSPDRRWLLVRLTLTAVGLLTTVYLGWQLMPEMEKVRALGDMPAFDLMHKQYEQISYVAVFIGIALIFCTCAVNIGSRRSGSNSRGHSHG